MTPTSSKLNAQFNEHICQHHITSHISCSTGSMPLSNLCLHGPQRSISKRRHQKGFGKVVQMPRPMGSQASQIVTVTIVTHSYHLTYFTMASHAVKPCPKEPKHCPRQRTWSDSRIGAPLAVVAALFLSFDVFWCLLIFWFCGIMLGLRGIAIDQCFRSTIFWKQQLS